METEEIRNRVEESGLRSLDLEAELRIPELFGVDLADFLEERVLLREKAFREQLKTWTPAAKEGSVAALYCSEDAIVPLWSWMLLAARLNALGFRSLFGNLKTAREQLYLEAFDRWDIEEFKGAKLMVKGCSESVPVALYVRLIERLLPVVQSLAFGEACSSVPVFKRALK
jgi:hypothetical protein